MSQETSAFLLSDGSEVPAIHISYECILRERTRESATYLYEVACSLRYPAGSAHLSLRVTSQNTYRHAAAKDIVFTEHANGATAYMELLEAEQLEVRIVEADGKYDKASYLAQGQELTELSSRRITSTLERLK